MELRDHSTSSLREELEQREHAQNSLPRRKAVAQTLRAIAFALEDNTNLVDGDRLDKVADAAYEIAWRGMPGGSCRQTGYVTTRGQETPDKAESGMDLGWAKVLGFRWPKGKSSWDVDDILGGQRDAVLGVVHPGHGTRSTRAW